MSDRPHEAAAPAAVLIVTGGDDPRRLDWLETCLRAIEERTSYPDHRLYVWNADARRQAVAELTDRFAVRARIDARPIGSPARRYAEGLQRLSEIARDDGAGYLVTLDAATLPLRVGWLGELIESLRGGAALAGVWHEPAAGTEPYVHPSCLGTTASFIEEQGLRFDQIARGETSTHESLSAFTRAAQRAGRSVSPWRRSNRNSLHPLVGGIYGDRVYRHGASPGLRVDASGAEAETARERRISELAAAMLLEHGEGYLDWLRGTSTRGRVFFVLGMHRSGTSCLTGCLEQCGVTLGDVTRRSVNQPLGNLEQRSVMVLNDALLAAGGGSWKDPPEEPAPECVEMAGEIGAVVSRLETAAPSALKDPRLLFTLDSWRRAAQRPALLGTFRHPAAVARSLWERERLPAVEAHDLWRRHNERLVALHRERPFPLIEFDLSDHEAYCRVVAAVAAKSGLEPRLQAILATVKRGLSSTSTARDPVPADCAEIYDYLRRHRQRGDLEPGSLAADLLAWGELAAPPAKARPERLIELWAWAAAARLPGRVRIALQRPVRWIARRLRARRTRREEHRLDP